MRDSEANRSGDKKSPLVSIGLPVCNGEKHLSIAIESAISQTFQNWEMLISDNASTDRTPEIIEKYVKLDSRISSVRHLENKGAPYNWNYIFNNAKRGKYFIWLSHDDVLLPKFLEATVEILERNTKVVLANTLQKRIDENSEIIAEEITSRQHRGFLSLNSSSCQQNKFVRMWRVQHKCGSTMIEGLIRRTALLRTTPICNLQRLGDVRLLLELSYLGPFRIHPEVQFIRRERRNIPNPTPKIYGSYMGWWKYIRESCENVGMSKLEKFFSQIIFAIAVLRKFRRRVVMALKRRIFKFVKWGH